MINQDASVLADTLRRLPSIDLLMRGDELQTLVSLVGTERLTHVSQSIVSDLRREVREMSVGVLGLSTEELIAEAVARIRMVCRNLDRTRTRPLINATGVVINTNLGRAPLSEKAREAVVAASGYCSVEYDIDTGVRGKRGKYAEELLTELTSAEAALVVNNCAAATFFILSAFASGSEVLISRGELVEIGGDFRIPDVLAQSGAILREVGTTNRTKIDDYEDAIDNTTCMILSVHPSNYRVVGFTASVGLEALSDLAHQNGLILYEDAGSGALIDLAQFGIRGEPLIPRSIRMGADLVSFSGDKLMGGPQCGIIVGRSDLIDKLRHHPLYRALRVDKLIYSALEATLETYRRGNALNELPVLRMISADEAKLETRCQTFVEKCRDLDDLHFEVIRGSSLIGGGAAPDARPVSPLIALRHRSITTTQLENDLRNFETPIITRIERDRVMIDLRTVTPPEELEIVRAFSCFAARSLP